MEIPHIYITQLPKWSYPQWFLLGFYLLEREKQITLHFRLPIINQLSLYVDNYYIYGIGQRYYSGKDTFNLQGYVEYKGMHKSFCIDHQDSPFLFDSELLEKVDVYFKQQCPIEFRPEGFYLTDDVVIPWTSHIHVNESLPISQRGERIPCDNLFPNLHKVKPLMEGPRHLGFGNGYKALMNGYNNYIKRNCFIAEKLLMCYFGNSYGPIPSSDLGEERSIDYNWESDIMAEWHGIINHPNEKRQIVSKLLSTKGDLYDARLIREGHSDGTAEKINKDKIVPLKDFCDHISHFQYNLNISGYRKSIPGRFIESFMVGTAILTDKLSVKWYKPFGKEVVETVEMGYLPNSEVNWQQFENDLACLPEVRKTDVLAAFEEKWAPIKVAEYILEEILSS